ncbi:carbohydrate ABC transporter permease [Oceanobacillus jeddahense]|uniref:carbohydrate ABC transporter permease n=1 Tax=Oceanobacillus jeddahense TaxID=1462527 RepID=UPI000595A5B4|nr:carbohydrate ABC transporter permease [Oceanobacillus jeddahense]
MIKKIILYLLLIISAFIMFAPIIYAVSVSFMTNMDVNNATLIPSEPTFEAYKSAAERIPLFSFLINSLVIAIIIMVGEIFLASLAAFALVFIPFKGRNVLFILLLSTMMVPFEATIVSNVLTIVNLEWMNTYQGIIVPSLVTIFGIFLFRQHFLTLPKELWEAAQMDGCSYFRYYFKFALPLSKTVIGTLAIFSFISSWNSYLWPLLITNDDSVRTIQIGLKMLVSSQASTNWPIVMAGSIIALLPTMLILFFGLKYIRKGLLSGSLKG